MSLSQSTIKRVSKLVALIEGEGLTGVKVCGSLRRGIDSTHDIDIMAIGDLTLLGAKAGAKRVTFQYDGMNVDVYAYEPEYYGAMALHLTGSAGHNIGFRILASKIGCKLNQYGLWRSTKRIAGRTEESIYLALGRAYKQPEERG